MTAFAEVGEVVTDLTQLSNTKCYTITPRGNDRGTWYYNAADASHLYSTDKVKATVSTTDPAQQFAFIKSESGHYYVYSVGGNKFLQYSSDGTCLLVDELTSSDSYATFLTSTGNNKEYPWVVALNGHHIGISNGYQYGVITHYNSTNDDGNCIKIVEAGNFDKSAEVIQQVEAIDAKLKRCDEANSYLNILANSVGGYSKDLLDALNKACGGDGVADFSDLENEGFDAAVNALKSATPISFSNDKVYKVRDFLADRGFLMTRTEEGNSRIFSSTKTGDATLALPVVEGSDIWQVYSDGTKMYLYNTAVKKYAKLDEPGNQWLLVDEPTPLNIGKNESKGAGVYWIQDCDYLGSQDYMHINVSQPDITGVKGWETSADASNFYFIEVDGEAQDLLNEVTKAVKAEAQLMLSFIDQTKANYVGVYSSTVSVENLNGLLSKENVTASEIWEGINELEANRMMPQSGKYYIFQNTKVFNDGSLKNIYENPDGVNIAWRTGTQEAAELWQIEPADDGRYYFKSANTGKYINQPLTKTATMKDNGTAYALMEQSYCSFGLEHQEPSDKVTLSLSNSDSWGILPNGSEESGKYLHTYNSYGTYPTQWNIIEVSSVNLTIGSTGYATACFPFAVTIPEGVKAYTVSAAADGVATLSPLTGTIPANTGVILSGDAKTYPFAITTSEVSKVEGNLLDGVTMATNIPETSYILANKNGNLGFYKVDPSDTKLAANKAYLVVNGAQQSLYRLNLDGAVTGIQSVENAAENAPAYDLQGRRLPQVPTKGLYIQNGKKIMK